MGMPSARGCLEVFKIVSGSHRQPVPPAWPSVHLSKSYLMTSLPSIRGEITFSLMPPTHFPPFVLMILISPSSCLVKRSWSSWYGVNNEKSCEFWPPPSQGWVPSYWLEREKNITPGNSASLTLRIYNNNNNHHHHNERQANLIFKVFVLEIKKCLMTISLSSIRKPVE